jgi:hypothetical protein
MENSELIPIEKEESNPAYCRNCETEIEGHYCHFCGQRYHDHKESFGELVYEFISDFVHFDSRFFRTALPLLFKPGKLTKSYIDGRQKSQFHPIRLYMFSSFLYFLLFFSFNKVENKRNEGMSTIPVADSNAVRNGDSIQKSEAAAIEKDTLVSPSVKKPSNVKYANFSITLPKDVEEMIKNKLTPEQYLAQQKKLPRNKRASYLGRVLTTRILQLNPDGEEGKKAYFEKVLESFFHNLPKVLFFLLPVFALYLKLLYIRNKKYYYVDHAILSLHCFSFIFLLLVLCNYILGKIFNTDLFTSFSIFWIMAWLLIAMKRLYKQGWGKTFLKASILGIMFFITMLVSIFINLAWSVFMM